MHMNRSRRVFIKNAAGAAAGLLSFPTIIPASALGRNGQIPPSDRIVLGSIGLGGMGRGNTNTFLRFEDVQVVAVCDVDSIIWKQLRNLSMPDITTMIVAGYEDYREMLEKESLDAVTIATPDHWHALLAVACANKGPGHLR